MGNEESKKHPLFGGAPLTDESLYTDQNGYFRRRLDKKLVHRVAYYQANPHANPRWQVHHINGKKKENDLQNLIALRPGLHKKLHETFSMKSLPSREEIIQWIEGGRRKPQKKQQGKSTRENAKKVRLFFQKGGKPNFPKGILDKPFTPKVIVRKGGERQLKETPEPQVPKAYKDQLLKCFRGRKRRRRKKKNKLLPEILITSEPKDLDFVDVRWQLWESKL